MVSFKVKCRKFNSALYFCMHSLPLCHIANSDTDSPRSHLCTPYHGEHAPGHSKIVRDGRKTFCRQYFVLLHYQNCWVTWGGATLASYLSFAVLGSTGNKFEITNFRHYCSKSKFYGVFKQDKCLSLDSKRIYIDWFFWSFVSCKTWINRLVPCTFHWMILRWRKRWS